MRIFVSRPTWSLLLGPAADKNPERATIMYSCHGVFTDQLIFRTILARIWGIF